MLAVLLLAPVISCAHRPDLQLNYPANYKHQFALGVDSCVEMIANIKLDAGPSYSDSIQLVSWNIEKNNHASLAKDLSSLTQASNLVMLQEAILTSPAMQGTSTAPSVSFSPGYVRRQSVSGVATYSSNRPLLECHLTNTEPVLRTQKATNITIYSMNDGARTLLVANVHGINFSLGLREFTRQMKQIEHIVDQHKGPVILGGDFNTWRSRRAELVDEMATRLSIQQVQFNKDHRTQYFGNVVDHIYIRGLTVTSSTTLDIESSDHNPLIVELAL